MTAPMIASQRSELHHSASSVPTTISVAGHAAAEPAIIQFAYARTWGAASQRWFAPVPTIEGAHVSIFARCWSGCATAKRNGGRRRAVRQRKRRRARSSCAMDRAAGVVYYDKSEVDSGSDYRYSETIPDSFDAETLGGVRRKRCNANECARGKVERRRPW